MKKIYKKWWSVPNASLKPSRSCAGMNETSHRSHHNLSDDARRLCVYGTLDPLARNGSTTTKTTVRYHLSDAGRRRLTKLTGDAVCKKGSQFFGPV